MSRSQYAHHWDLDPDILYLNHGSFGACPREVLDVQSEHRRRMEANAVNYLIREVSTLVDNAREILSEYVGAAPDELAFVSNATTGVNTVLRSLPFGPGDEIIVTDHEYNACRNAVNVVAAASGATVVVAKIPLPLLSPDDAVEAVLSKVTDHTRLLLIDHITSPTAFILPVEEIVRELDSRGIDTLVDGAHAIGMLDLNLDALGAAYYTGNCHKWLCTPKGSALLYVRRDKQEGIRPTVISHGANSPITNRSFFHNEFDWTGTHDPSPYLSIPAAIRFLDSLTPGGRNGLHQHNYDLVRAGRKLLIDELKLRPLCPGSMLGMMASLEIPSTLPSLDDWSGWDDTKYEDPLEQLLFEQHNIVVPVIRWPAPQKRMIRISAQAYNDQSQYAVLARALNAILIKGQL